MTSNITAQLLYEQKSEYRGGDYVWKKEKGKRSRSFQVSGSHLMNPFTNGGILYAGDLLKVNDTDKEALLLKVFKTTAAIAAEATTIVVSGDHFSHIPSVGDIIMVAPDEVDDTGQSAKITAVEWEDGEFTLTIDTELVETSGDAIPAGTLLVEANGAAANASATVLIDRVNMFVAADEVQGLPKGGGNGYTVHDFVITPIEHDSAIIAKMSPIPAYLQAYNKSNLPETYFEL